MKLANFFLNLILGIIIGLFVGWNFAHKEVATECQRQGGFYVGSKDYYCFEKI